MNPLVTIAIVNWNGEQFLRRCIQSIFEQNYRAVEVIVVDNASTDRSVSVVEESFSGRVQLVRNKNVGYTGGANLAISLSKGEFVIIANSDIVFGADYIGRCVEALAADPKAGVASGKLLKYDFDADRALDIIDSAGIAMSHFREAYDIGQNELDNGQYDVPRRVFGVCGVAAVFKRTALEAVKLRGEYFDPDFFTYKEDIDICWRLNLYGFTCLYLPTALAYHGRQWKQAEGLVASIRARRKKSVFLKGISFRNHYFMLVKNETPQAFRRDFLRICIGAMKYLVYFALFDRQCFKYIGEIFAKKELMLEKRREIMAHRRISDEEVYHLFDR